MDILHTINEARRGVSWARSGGLTVGLVPTMGALHDGHMRLIQTAREQCGYVVVSIFVNPTQFGQGEDFTRYPRTLETDAAKCEAAGVNVIFAPSAAEMYPPGFDSWIEVDSITRLYEGAHRPGHFRGVTTVCAKLFNIVQPDRAYFGMKDYQQLQVIRKMVRDLNMPLEIVPVETVREPDGLAMSSRNAYLSEDERRGALVLSRALAEAKNAYDSGERCAASVQDVAKNIITLEQSAQIDYVAVADAETLEPLETIDRPAVLLLAVRFPSARLIDNIVLGY